ncbi:MAG: hypothetical protein WKG07_05735 [Hymenobacter sp.]
MLRRFAAFRWAKTERIAEPGAPRPRPAGAATTFRPPGRRCCAAPPPCCASASTELARLDGPGNGQARDRRPRRSC